jgi:hypothetical protein
MEYAPLETQGYPWKSVMIGVALTFLVILLSLVFIQYNSTRPLISGFNNKEGFAAVNGVGNVPCGQDSVEAEQLYGMFIGRSLTKTEDGKKDLNDLRNLLAKLSCMKRDLLSPSGFISASNELRFCTYSDIQPSAETTSRCLSKQIPERDLEIQFEKWKQYGTDLLMRLCTDASLSEAEVINGEKLFTQLIDDVYSISKIKCLTGKAIEENPGPRDPAKYMAPELKNLSEYEGYSSMFF